MTNRVVITGMGVISPIGCDRDTAWNNLVNGQSGIDYLEKDSTPFMDKIDINIVGRVKDFDIADYYPEKANAMKKDMDIICLFSMAAAKQAISQAGLDKATQEGTHIQPEDVSMIIGTGIGGMDTTCADINTLMERGPKRVGVRSIIRLMPNASSGQIGIEYGFKGRAKSESTACASGLDSILSGYNDIKYGLTKAVIAGGSEGCVIPLALASFSNMRALSKRECKPEEASTPFSADRDGFVMGEGSVVFVLENRDIAIARGATILAEVMGGEGTCDAYHITAPHSEGEGASRAIGNAIKNSGIKPEDIDYIHAHGTSTPLNDARETLAIKNVFGDHAYKLAVSSTKSMTGHMIGAAGPMGVFASVQAMNNNILPPTINYNNPDPECDLDYVPNKARSVDNVQYSMINALGFGGHNTSLIIKKAD